MKRLTATVCISLALTLIFSCHNLVTKLLPPQGNKITSFSLSGKSAAIVGDSISITLDNAADISAAIPLIRAEEGATVLPITYDYIKAAFPSASPEALVKDWLASGSKAAWALGVLKANPNFTVPALTIPINFSMPVLFAVISAQGSTRLYTVNVTGGKTPDFEPSASNRIQAFSVPGQIGESTINDSSASVTFTMNQLADVRALIPSVTVSDTSLPLPLTLAYLRRSFPSTDIYDLFLSYYLAGDKAAFLRDKIKATPDFVPPQAILDLPIDFSTPVPFAVLSWDFTVALYTVNAQKISTEAQITAFTFPKALNPVLVRDAQGTINEATKTITMTAWLPAEYTPEKKYIPSFTLAGDESGGSKLCYKGGAEITGKTSVIDCSSGFVSLTAQRSIGGITEEKDYVLNITHKKDPNTIRSITDFRFTQTDNPALITDAVAAVYDTGETGLISVTVPYKDVKPAKLQASFISGGFVTDKEAQPLSSGSEIDTPEVSTLLCSSKDGTRWRTYTLKITYVHAPGGANPQITSFAFSRLINTELTEDSTAFINHGAGTIFATIKYSGIQAPRSLIPEFSANGNVTVDGILQTPGGTAQNFAYQVLYTVTSPYNDTLSKTYRVQLAYVSSSASACDLYSLHFKKDDNPGLAADVHASINPDTRIIHLLFPYDAHHTANDFTASYSAAGTVYLNGAQQAGGVMRGRFTDGSQITVRSVDGSNTKTFTLRVGERGSTIYVNAKAAGVNNGTSWADAYKSLESALAERNNIPAQVPVQVYVAATADYKPAAGKSFIVTGNTKLYGGFMGTEAKPEEREKITDPSPDPFIFPDGRQILNKKTALKANGQRVITAENLTGDVLFDGLEISGGTYYNQNLGDKGQGAGFYSGTINRHDPYIIYIAQCDFKNNNANGFPAVMLEMPCVISASSFTDNEGSGLRLTDLCTITDSMFNNNNRGGLYISHDNQLHGSSTITNCTMNYNSFNGGYFARNSTQPEVPLTVDHCQINYNGIRGSSNTYGIGMSKTTVIRSEFKGNMTKQNWGGGASFASSTVIDCLFEKNESVHYGGGGASMEGTGSFLRCTFINNSALSGGGLGILGSNVVIDDCDFISNTATAAPGVGGAILLAGSTSTLIKNSRFKTNTAQKGGAIGINTNAEITNNIFTSNSADTGGAIYADISSFSERSATFSYNTFINNTTTGNQISILYYISTYNGTKKIIGLKPQTNKNDASKLLPDIIYTTNNTYNNNGFYITGPGITVE